MAAPKKSPSSTRRKRRGPYEPEKLRASILDAAIRSFARQGFFQTSFQSIATDLNVSQSAIMNHYPDKLFLIRETVHEVIRRSHAFVEQEEDPHLDARERLTKYCDRTATWALTHPEEAQVLLLLYYLSSCNEDFREIYVKILQIARKRILVILLAGVREKSFRFTEKPEVVAELFHDWVLGAILNEITVKRLKKIPGIYREKREALFRGLLGCT